MQNKGYEKDQFDKLRNLYNALKDFELDLTLKDLLDTLNYLNQTYKKQTADVNK